MHIKFFFYPISFFCISLLPISCHLRLWISQEGITSQSLTGTRQFGPTLLSVDVQCPPTVLRCFAGKALFFKSGCKLFIQVVQAKRKFHTRDLPLWAFWDLMFFLFAISLQGREERLVDIYVFVIVWSSVTICLFEQFGHSAEYHIHPTIS